MAKNHQLIHLLLAIKYLDGSGNVLTNCPIVLRLTTKAIVGDVADC